MIESRLTLRRTHGEAAYKCGSTPSSLHNPVINAQLPTHPTPIKSPVAEPLNEGQQSSSLLDRNPVDLERLGRKIITVADDLNAMLDWKALSANHQHLTDWLALYGLDPLDSDTTRTVVSRQTVLTVLLKGTLYEYYQRCGDLPSLSSPVGDAFRHAKEQTGNSGFEEFALDTVIEHVDEAFLDEILEERVQLLRSGKPAADLGRLYEMVIPGDNRQVLSQFRTPSRVGSLVRSWVGSTEGPVLDPGISAAQLTRPFDPLWEMKSDLEQVYGVEKSPLSALMGATVLTISRQDHHLQTTDFISLLPDDLEQQPQALVCNPPYTRHERLSPEYKEIINDQAEEETGLDIPLNTPLYPYFIYHSRRFLTAGNRAIFVTPQAYLNTTYGEPLKKFLLSEFNVRGFILYDPDDESVYDEAQVTCLLTLLEATDDSESSSNTQFLRIDEKVTTAELLSAIDTPPAEGPRWGCINSIPQDELDPEANWQALFDPVEIDTSRLVPLGELADVHRGISTGENDYFCLTQEEKAERGIERQHLSRLVPSPKVVNGYEYRTTDWTEHRDQGSETWLLYIPDHVDGVPNTIADARSGDVEDFQKTVTEIRDGEHPSPGLIDYLWSGLLEHDDLTGRTVIRNRSRWYHVDRRKPAPILVPYMSRSEFRAIRNTAHGRYVNNYIGIYPAEEVTQLQQKALLAYLNSTFVNEVASRYERTIADGLNKREPGALKELPVLDPREVPKAVQSHLSSLFDELCDVARRGGNEDKVVECIDEALQREFDLSTDTKL